MAPEIAIVSFYSFVKIEEPEMLIPKILLVGKKKSLRGTILIAKEGFNGSISGPLDKTEILLEAITNLTNASDVNVKINYSKEHPFHKLKVKLKPEIISMGIDQFEVAGNTGEYIETKDWDEFISRDDVILVDTRNDYEVEVGTFEKAIDPKTETFKQFPEWAKANSDLFKDKKIAMCCTGGVRCEKSTAYMKSLGYNEVYHLKGGILQYLEDTGNQNGKWRGECFVFDDRRAVDDDLAPADIIPNSRLN
ncbi:MAG: rhodanese-like domain-containing protein [Pseudomonadota bacterium]